MKEKPEITVVKSDKSDYKFMVIAIYKNTKRVLAYVPTYYKDQGSAIAIKIAELLEMDIEVGGLFHDDINVTDTFYG
jgi:hypothetical protein